ncbi:MAG: undecaprenyldiphospho-muramoylpentapeptide beta-N-acetylglucosaminyltransferase [Tissierellia bacterium]|nr:undecaprenyldiphospho-muramoylpentapeptide beta-N-acetylglucosaminyltransferase [Tissierellia bacterium]
MRVIFSGGGTGGHIYPALSIIDELKNTVPDVEILYVGKKGSLEEELVTREGIDFATIRVKGLPRKKINKDSFLSLYELMKGLKDASGIIKRFKPHLVFGTGGYVCAPILLKAQMSGIPTMIQEQNAYPGKTNRLLGRRVQSICLSFPEAEEYFPGEVKKVFTGNPIRRAFRDAVSQASGEEQLVLSFGGSGGQESTNEAVLEMMRDHPHPPFQLIHITGKDHYEKFVADAEKFGGWDENAYTVLNYSHEIPELLKKSHLVIASSSAMTLAEISAMGLPSILIPKAYTAGNHQWHNAKSYERAAASLVIEEEELTGAKLYAGMEKILGDRELSASMGEASRAMANPRADEKIVEEILRVVGS